ncbi:hypothetical protein IMCC26256_111822 [Actinobacteria bacterium IMCC26256]|nr:hypothetical protein IMCC26256_111822 [Actinobacteria bacterium IMCC26256]
MTSRQMVLVVDERTGSRGLVESDPGRLAVFSVHCGHGVTVAFDIHQETPVRVDVEEPADLLALRTVEELIGWPATKVIAEGSPGDLAEIPSPTPALSAALGLAWFERFSTIPSMLDPDLYAIEHFVRFDALAEAGAPVDGIVERFMLRDAIRALASFLRSDRASSGVPQVLDDAIEAVARYVGTDAPDVVALKGMVRSAREATFRNGGEVISGESYIGEDKARKLVFAAASDDERVDTLEVHLGHYSPFFGFGEEDIRTRRDDNVVRVWVLVQPGVLLPESPETAAPYHAHMTQWTVVIFDANDRSVLASGPGMLFQDPLGLLTPDECKGNLIAVLEFPETTSLRDVYVAVRPSDDIGVGETPDERALAVGRRWAWRAAWYRQLHAAEVREQPAYTGAKMLRNAKDAYLNAASSFEQTADTWFQPRGNKDLEGEARRLAALCRGYADLIAAD